MNILISGGAGYIGSHTARLLHHRGHEIWAYDNLSTGHRGAAIPGRLIEGNLTDRAKLVETLQSKKVEAVIHFAASALVGESVIDPAKYYQNNIVASCALFEAMREAGVSRIVFSSTAATYGTPERMPITEQAPQQPINPYGFTKLAIERALRDYAAAYGWGYAALRYFNAAGASTTDDIGEDHDPETHLIPIILQVALGQREAVNIFGSDYPTSDGTCLRDYIHVDDLATAHLAALERLTSGKGLEMNLGTGRGYTVQEVVEAAQRVTGRKIRAVKAARRPGDPAELVADSSLAQRTLNWQPKYIEIETIVETAWKWHQRHPKGYGQS